MIPKNAAPKPPMHRNKEDISDFDKSELNNISRNLDNSDSLRLGTADKSIEGSSKPKRKKELVEQSADTGNNKYLNDSYNKESADENDYNDDKSDN